MNALSLSQVLEITGAACADAACANADLRTIAIDAVCTDSRRMRPGSLFIALRGENFDGHNFVDAAHRAGAAAALVDRVPANSPKPLPLLKVSDTRRAMGRLARAVRQNFRGKVIAVAGSNGKTGTKHLIDAALKSTLRGSISPRSFNNDIGVPLAIFPADPGDDYLVLEIGTNHPGEIRTLADIALPDIGVITNCHAEHLEGLGDLQGVRRENCSIIQGIPRAGTLLVNGDDPELLQALASFQGKRVTFGLGSGNDLFASQIRCGVDGTRFLLNGITPVFVSLLGQHAAINALAAVAAAREMGICDADAIESLNHASGPEMRLQLQQVADISILNDAYNANPASMKAALQTLGSLPTAGRRIAVLGDMRELGPTSPRHHAEVGKFVAEIQPDLLACVGPLAREIAGAAIEAGFPRDRIETHGDSTAAAASLAPRVRAGDLVLLKASRALRLEVVGRAIASIHEPRKIAS